MLFQNIRDLLDSLDTIRVIGDYGPSPRVKSFVFTNPSALRLPNYDSSRQWPHFQSAAESFETASSMGISKQELDDPDAKIEEWRQAVSQEPDNRSAHSCLGLALKVKGVWRALLQNTVRRCN